MLKLGKIFFHKTNNIVKNIICIVVIACILEGCSTKCYESGETTTSGTKNIDILGVLDSSNTTGWIETDIVLEEGQDIFLDVFGKVNICPPKDPTDCSSNSDFCELIYA